MNENHALNSRHMKMSLKCLKMPLDLYYYSLLLLLLKSILPVFFQASSSSQRHLALSETKSVAGEGRERGVKTRNQVIPYKRKKNK